MNDQFTNMLKRKLTVDWAQASEPLDLRYHSLGIGGINSMPPPKNIVDGAAKLKPSMVRIFLQEYFFFYPDHGVYDWSKLDAYMDAVHAMGGDIMASICFKPKPLYPVLNERIWMPNDVKEWQEVIKALVLRYSKEKPYVTHWAVANEMDQKTGGGCPYYIESPDDYYEYYKMTIEPIREVLPNVKVGGPSTAGGGGRAARYITRFIELCKENDVHVDFASFNAYTDNPDDHVNGGRIIRDEIDRIDPCIKLYMTEFNCSLIGIWGDDYSLEEKPYNPKRAASLAASILAFHEDGCLDGSFQYHIYDQMNDLRQFQDWYEYTRMMTEHWNDLPHRLGLFDLDGRVRPQYFMYKMVYMLTGKRAALDGTDSIMRGVASHNDEGVYSVFLTNFTIKGTPDAVTQLFFKNAPEGVYRLNVYRIDNDTSVDIKKGCIPVTDLPMTESRLVYSLPDFHFEVFTPADSVTLIQFVKEGV